MSELFLTRAEVAELTGAKTKRKQLEVLRKNGTRHTLNAAGWPVVPRAVVEGTAAPEQDGRPAWQPNATKRRAA